MSSPLRTLQVRFLFKQHTFITRLKCKTSRIYIKFIFHIWTIWINLFFDYLNFTLTVAMMISSRIRTLKLTVRLWNEIPVITEQPKAVKSIFKITPTYNLFIFYLHIISTSCKIVLVLTLKIVSVHSMTYNFCQYWSRDVDRGKVIICWA